MLLFWIIENVVNDDNDDNGDDKVCVNANNDYNANNKEKLMIIMMITRRFYSIFNLSLHSFLIGRDLFPLCEGMVNLYFHSSHSLNFLLSSFHLLSSSKRGDDLWSRLLSHCFSGHLGEWHFNCLAVAQSPRQRSTCEFLWSAELSASNCYDSIIPTTESLPERVCLTASIWRAIGKCHIKVWLLQEEGREQGSIECLWGDGDRGRKMVRGVKKSKRKGREKGKEAVEMFVAEDLEELWL